MKNILKVKCKQYIIHVRLMKYRGRVLYRALTVYAWRLHSMPVSGRFSSTAVDHKLTSRFDPKSTSCCGTVPSLSSSEKQQDLLGTTCSSPNIRYIIIELLTNISNTF